MSLREFLLGSANERRAIDAQQAQLDKQRRLAFGLRRRQLLTTMVTASGIVGLTATIRALVVGFDQTPQQREKAKEGSDYVPFSEFIAPISKAEVRRTLNGLKDSPYKTFALKNIGDLFNDTEPPSIKIAEEDFRVYGVQVAALAVDQDFLGGQLRLRTAVKTPALYLSQPANFIISLPYFYGETPLRVGISFSSEQKLGEGIEPGLFFMYKKSYKTPRNNIPTMEQTRRLSIIKESFTLAYIVALAGDIVTSMKAQGLPLSIVDQGRNIEMVWNAILALSGRNNSKNRFLAMIDASPVIMTLKATTNDSDSWLLMTKNLPKKPCGRLLVI